MRPTEGDPQKESKMQKVKTLGQPIESETPGTPLVLRIITKAQQGMVEGGTTSVDVKQEFYVCVSQLPHELQERVRLAVEQLLRP